MNKEQMRQQKIKVDEQVNLLKMLYDKVEVLDYKIGLIKCKCNNVNKVHLYKFNTEILTENNIYAIYIDKYFIRVYLEEYENSDFGLKMDSNRNPIVFGRTTHTLILNKRTLNEVYKCDGVFGRTTHTLILNKRTLNEVYKCDGVLHFSSTICNGKYVIANVYSSLDRGKVHSLLFDINNSRFVMSSENGLIGLLETLINKVGKGVMT